MAMATKNFYGEVGGESIQKLYRFLDPSLKTYEERLKQSLKVYYEDEQYTKLREIWLTVFDDDRIKTNINSTDSVMSETNVCKLQEAVCSYLLFADDVKNMQDEDGYKIKVLDTTEMAKGESRNQSLDALLENEESDMSHILLVEKNETNFKKQIKQVVTSKDYTDKEIGDVLTCYKRLYDSANKELAVMKSASQYALTEKDFNKFRRRIRQLGGIKPEIEYDMVQTKDQLKRTIYFKAIAPTSGGDPEDYINIENFDYWDKNLIRLLAQVNNPKTEFGEIYLDKFNKSLEKLIINDAISEEDAIILEAYRNDKNMYDLAESMGTTFQNIYKRVTMALNLVQRQMIEDYELDYYYTEIVRGNWKKCSKCGEIYPRNEYYWNKQNSKSDGLQPHCKKCNAERQKNE